MLRWMEYIAEFAWSVGNVLRWSLGAWGKLVAGVDGHVEYIAEVAWVRGGSLLRRSMGTWSIFRRSLGVWGTYYGGRLARGGSLLCGCCLQFKN
ncbi:hypothetical protein NST41_25895 [Paenibacillus sp. FSL L8-0696]|uniref:hypothetical protein n=1 Tax=Paenibacillus sp. FSL L8-0696 TaxID=2954524 RepID=UPI00311A1B2A